MDPVIEPDRPLTEAEVANVETALGRRLPGAYRVFLRSHGGAFVGGNVDAAEGLSVLAFHGADELSRLLHLHEDYRAQGALPIASCELGGLYVLDATDRVRFVITYGGQTKTELVADCFETFVGRLVVAFD